MGYLSKDYEMSFAVYSENIEGKFPELFIIKHCLARKEVNISDFSLKFIASLCW